MSYFLCDDCKPPYYARSEREVLAHEAQTGHTFFDDSPEWTI